MGILLFWGADLFASAPDTAWTRAFEEMDYAYSGTQTQDGGYVVTGDIVTGGLTGLALLKIDLLGNEEWNKTFGNTPYDEGRYVQQTQDGGYIPHIWVQNFLILC